MSIISDIEKVSANKISVYTLLILTLICPGLLSIFLYQRELFLQLDVIKLTMLSVSISAPILLINSILGASMDFAPKLKKESSENKEDNRFFAEITAFGCLLTNVIFGVAVFSKLFLNYDLKGNILIVMFSQALFVVYAISGYSYAVIKNKMKGKKA